MCTEGGKHLGLTPCVGGAEGESTRGGKCLGGKTLIGLRVGVCRMLALGEEEGSLDE